MKERLDFGTFKKTLVQVYGKEHDTFSHYFTIKRKK
jgi:hypothetical protein